MSTIARLAERLIVRYIAADPYPAPSRLDMLDARTPAPVADDAPAVTA